MLWLIPGEYNIPNSGYASMSSFFTIAPILLLFLIPALAMRSFAEEKRMHTILLLKSRPITDSMIISSKIAALFFTVLITLFPTIIYVICIYFYGNPVGNIDLGAVAASYIGLLFLVLALISMSVFASSLTSNQVIALVIGMLLCVFFYFGFNLIGLEKLSFLTHYQSIQRGLIEVRDLFYFLFVAFLFFCFTLISLSPNARYFDRKEKSAATLFLLAFVSFFFLNLRFDWTCDKRYTINPITKNLLHELTASLEVEIYLSENLNPGFLRLQKATIALVNDLNRISPQSIHHQIVDPYRKGKDFIQELDEIGITGISVNERTSSGKIVQNILFPYALVKYRDAEIPISLLVNQPGRSGEENLNLSIELLEYQFAHAIQLLTQKKSQRIAFLEGNGELPEESISEITDYLSYEYTIDRGILSGRQGELDEYDLVIIAGPQLPFSEPDKFVLDQYLMQGGNLLWFVDGVKLQSYQAMRETGETLAMANDLNLEDLFFDYGFRINPVILKDLQSIDIPVVVEESNQRDYIPQAWYYAPLLIPALDSEITKDLSFVKTEFASTLSFVGENSENKKVLLTSSPFARSVRIPALVGMNELKDLDRNYFNESYLPVAALLKSPFVSAFHDRQQFFAQSGQSFLTKSQPSKMIVIASSNILLNPLGYDIYSDMQFANREFVMNAVNYLTDNHSLFSLKNKSFQVQLLNRSKIQQDFNRLILINIIFPPAILLIVFFILFVIRKRCLM
jgi:ABC-2 type transport system permease protein